MSGLANFSRLIFTCSHDLATFAKPFSFLPPQFSSSQLFSSLIASVFILPPLTFFQHVTLLLALDQLFSTLFACLNLFSTLSTSSLLFFILTSFHFPPLFWLLLNPDLFSIPPTTRQPRLISVHLFSYLFISFNSMPG